MDNQKILYCFIMSEEQMEFLRSKKYKIDRMECFLSLVAVAERETRQVQVSKTQQVEVLGGQVMIDNTQLAKLWNKDRKTVPKLLEAMESMGISSSQKVGEYRIHTLHTLSGWYVNGRFKANDFASKRNSDGSGVFHADVPPAKVIIIEDEDTKNKDGKGRPFDECGSANANEYKSSITGGHESRSSSQSNDSRFVGKSSINGGFSKTSTDGSSSLDGINQNSAAKPSSGEEADGKQN